MAAGSTKIDQLLTGGEWQQRLDTVRYETKILEYKDHVQFRIKPKGGHPEVTTLYVRAKVDNEKRLIWLEALCKQLEERFLNDILFYGGFEKEVQGDNFRNEFDQLRVTFDGVSKSYSVVIDMCEFVCGRAFFKAYIYEGAEKFLKICGEVASENEAERVEDFLSFLKDSFVDK